jgi:hypothetical protein
VTMRRMCVEHGETCQGKRCRVCKVPGVKMQLPAWVCDMGHYVSNVEGATHLKASGPGKVDSGWFCPTCVEGLRGKRPGL